MFNYTQTGYLCPMETPEHAQVGLIKQLTLIGNITINRKEQPDIIKELINDYIKKSPCVSRNTSMVFLNGEWICNVISEELHTFLDLLRNAKLNNKISYDVSISYNDITDEILIGAPEIDKVFFEFMDFIKDCVLVAHNADFDAGFINRTAK